MSETDDDVEVVFDFTPEAGDESCLEIHVGDVVRVIQRKPGEWWCGQLGDKKGWFPMEFVKSRDKAAADRPAGDQEGSAASDSASDDGGALVPSTSKRGSASFPALRDDDFLLRSERSAGGAIDLISAVRPSTFGLVNILEMPSHSTSDSFSPSESADVLECSSQFSDSPEELVRMHINGRLYTVPAGNVLSACHSVGEYVASLCYHPRLPALGKCKSCVVEVQMPGESMRILSACTTSVLDGMIVRTNTEETKKIMTTAIANMLRARFDRSLPPLSVKSRQLELIHAIQNARSAQKDVSNGAVMRDMSLCIECGRCVQACREVQGMNVYTLDSEDKSLPLKTYNNKVLHDTFCIACGQCTAFCPSGALAELPEIGYLLRAFGKKTVVGFIAPAVRVAVSEGFGLKAGVVSSGRIVTALKRIGFDYVFDNQFTADLTIMEEGSELLERLKGKGALPMFTSCCPAWVNMVEKVYPKLIPHLSSCRSPQGMMGSLIRNHFAEKTGLAHTDIFIVSIMPCVAKKAERRRPQLSSDGQPDVDCVLTTRELIELIDMKGLDFKNLADTPFDDPLGRSTGAGALFAVSGGVMEAAVRTAYELATHKKLEQLTFTAVRGIAGLKEATVPLMVPIRKANMRVAVVNGGANCRALVDKVLERNSNYDFVEFMCCPGGCIGGGGQPQSNDPRILLRRMGGHYGIDEQAPLRKSHENPSIQVLYKDYLDQPNSAKAHKLLHTVYEDRSSEAKDAVIIPQEMTYDMNRRKSRKFDKRHFIVLYATQTGNAYRIAHTIEEKLKKAGMKVEICRFDMYPYENLVTENCWVIFVTSTFWDGEFPENGQYLWKKIRDAKRSRKISDVHYSVFGLGSSAYAHFNRASQRLDDTLKKHGATPLVPRAEADTEKSGGYDDVVESFVGSVIKAAKASKV